MVYRDISKTARDTQRKPVSKHALAHTHHTQNQTNRRQKKKKDKKNRPRSVEIRGVPLAFFCIVVNSLAGAGKEERFTLVHNLAGRSVWWRSPLIS